MRERDLGIQLFKWLKLQRKVNMLLVANRTKFSCGDRSFFLAILPFNMSSGLQTVKIEKYFSLTDHFYVLQLFKVHQVDHKVLNRAK